MSYGYRFLKGLLITGASFGFTLYADGLTQTCSAPQFPQPAATNIDSVCGAAGSGGKEANQNQAKNNFCPTAAAKPITIPDMVALHNSAGAPAADESAARILSADKPASLACGPMASAEPLDFRLDS